MIHRVSPRAIFRLILISVLLLVPTSSTIALEWIEQDVAGLGSGSMVYGCSADGIGVSQTNADAILFFNARTGTWLRHELDTTMAVTTIRAEGCLVLVVGSDRAVAYNTGTDTVAELVYNGSLLASSGDTRSFDCGYYLALVVTDQEFCVFDAETDQWRRLAYALPGVSAFTVRHQCHDSYAASFLPLTNNIVVNLVYSLNQHDFNQTDMGLHAPATPMDHGFAGFRNQYQADDYLLGYSAVTNTFDRVDFVDGSTWYSATLNPSEAIGPRTAFAAYYEETYPDDIRHYHAYGYDTRHGNWVHELYMVNDTEFRLGTSWRAGGSFCATTYWNLDAGQDDLLVFDGTANSFDFQTTDLDHYIGIVSGGDVLLARKGDEFMGLAVADPGRDTITVGALTYDRTFAGLNHLNFLSDGPDDLVTVNYYNGNARTWQHHVTGPHTSEGWGTPHVHLRLGGEPQREAVFYSAYRDEVYGYSLGDWSSASPSVTDNYAVAYNGAAQVGILYDAHRGSVYSWDNVDSVLLGGDRIVALIDNGADEARAYSLVTGTWSTQVLEEDAVVDSALDLVALIKHTAGNVYHACYAGDGSWSRLDPYGTYGGRAVGQRTALYLTGYRAYGLGTGGVTPVPSEQPIPVVAPSIEQVHPNPANPLTTVDFFLARAQKVRVSVYDLSGRLVRVLADDHLAQGSHSLKWDGRDGSDRVMASGAYIVALNAQDGAATSKVMLVR